MIILDTHIWIWWVDGNMGLTERHQHTEPDLYTLEDGEP